MFLTTEEGEVRNDGDSNLPMFSNQDVSLVSDGALCQAFVLISEFI